MCLQCPSCLFVLKPLLLTNSLEWLTVSCKYPFSDSLEYDFQQSDTIRVPGSIHSLIIGKSVASLRSSTATRKHFRLSSSMPPKTHCPSTLCPRWYYLLPTLLSSIWTVLPGPPIFSLFCRIVTSHVSLQKLSQSTAVLGLIFSCRRICH